MTPITTQAVDTLGGAIFGPHGGHTVTTMTANMVEVH